MVKLTALASKQNSSLTKSLRNANLSAGALLTALLGVSQLSYANLPLGNTAGTNNIAIGQNSFASGTGSQAVGTGAIATGGNITPEQFGDELVKFRAILAQIEQTRTQIAQHERDSTVNQNLQEALNRQIAEYEAILERVREKQEKQAVLNGQKSAKQAEIDQANTRLAELQTEFGKNAFLPSGNKESYRNFLNIINALDWNKLNTSTGIADLTADLKNGVEKDFGVLNISDDKYREVIEGYRNAQGNITFLKPIFSQRLDDEFKNKLMGDDRISIFKNRASGYSYTLPIVYIESSFNSNRYIKDANPYSTENLYRFFVLNQGLDALEVEEKYPIEPPKFPSNSRPFSPEREAYTKAYEEWRIGYEQFMIERKYYHRYIYNNILSYVKNKVSESLYSDQNGAFYKAMQNYKGEIYTNAYPPYTYRNEELGLNFIIAPVKRQLLNTEFLGQHDLNRIISTSNQITQEITLDDLVKLEKIVSSFNAYNNLIDYNNNDAWIFDKEEFRSYMNGTVIPFMGKLEELATTLRSLENGSLSEDERNIKAAKIIELRKAIKQTYDNNEKYYIHQFEPTTWNINIKDEVQKARDRWIEYEKEAQATLLPYNNNNLAIKEIHKAVNAKADEIKTQQEGINTKQAEIADLETQINALALTGEEQSAEKVKLDLTKKLDEAKAALTTLNQTLREKRDALLALDTELTNSPLGKKGDNAIAEGTKAFASGANAIAVGSESRAIGDQSIAIGHQAKALKDKALAIGNNAVANAEAAIAIGDNAGVSGQNAVGIGANSLVTGKNAVSVGANNIVAHDNAVAIGANITKTAANSVNLGNESEATVERTEQTAGTTNYAYADILGSVYQFAAAEPVGVVTVGGKGKERRVQNVAAGLVSRTSTDAVNGSQLFALAEAVDQGAIGLVRQHPTNGVIGIANHRLGNEVNIANAAGEARRLSGVADAVAPTDAVNKGQFDREIGGLNSRVSGVEKQVNRIKGAVSNAVAMASMPQATNAGQRMVSVGTGHTHGITAVSVGLSGLSDNGKVSFKVNTSVSQKSDFAVGAGLGFAW